MCCSGLCWSGVCVCVGRVGVKVWCVCVRLCISGMRVGLACGSVCVGAGCARLVCGGLVGVYVGVNDGVYVWYAR